ncbi:hypothetical protein CBR_g39271 [Chara braunii]|uniref:Uncharacterized protein n=1 Tax=Chara braunii TaxID=69332 RepID=A0A388K114_CHABU|nr:hypothetical protein CBR_g39271 [Chara braunii]|eukprot:GBG63729.1 hypothetical protein CBR_g39271 [Chara braunii]
MSSTLVPFDTPDEDLPDIAKRVRQSSADCFPTQQTSSGGSRLRKKQSQPRRHTEEGARGPSVESARLKECAGPSRQSAQQRGGTPVVTSSRKGSSGRRAPDRQEGNGGASKRAALRERSEGSDEETENDSKIHVERNAQGNLAVDDEQCGVQEDAANEDISEREREGEEREDSLPDCEDGESRLFDGGDYGDGGENDDNCLADDEDGGEEGSDDMEVDEGAGDLSEGSVQKRKRRSSTSPTGAADKRAAKRLTVAVSREALRVSQEAATDSVKNRKGKALTRATKAEKRPMKRKQMVDEGDSGEDAEGAALRAPSEQTERSSDNRSVTVDTTKCFFLEFDEDGYARKDRVHIQVDVTKILPIPEGDILYNHRTLDEKLVQSIHDAIHNAAKETSGKWDFMSFILAPIVPCRDDSQGRRITPQEFDVEEAHTYHWYAVAGQHTVEAMNKLTVDKSPTEKKYGLRSYSHVCVVYFDDNTKRGYPYVSAFDNTREERSVPRSFSSSVWQIRTYWEKRCGRIRLPGTVSPNDVEGLKQKKKWEEFMNAACKMAPDSSLVTSSLENEYCKDWTNKMRGYMNLAQCGETVWPLVDRFLKMYEEGQLPRVDGVKYIDLSGKVEGRLPGQYFIMDNSGKKILFHCIKAKKGPPDATVSIPDLTPSSFKLFGDMIAREKQVALHHMMRADVIVTSRMVPRGGCNMADLVMQSVYKWDDVEVLTGSLYRHYTPSTTVNRYGNIAVRYIDMMTIVLHAENRNLSNITIAPKLRAELTNLNIEEGEFVRCSGECIGVEGDTEAVYSWMEREPARLRKLCSSFIREDDGVMLLGKAHAGLI